MDLSGLLKLKGVSMWMLMVVCLSGFMMLSGLLLFFHGLAVVFQVLQWFSNLLQVVFDGLGV